LTSGRVAALCADARRLASVLKTVRSRPHPLLGVISDAATMPPRLLGAVLDAIAAADVHGAAGPLQTGPGRIKRRSAQGTTPPGVGAAAAESIRPFAPVLRRIARLRGLSQTI
jgi:hypothetical protein